MRNITLFVMILVLLLSGCRPAQQPTVTTSNPQPAVGLAQVDGVEVLELARPAGDVRIFVQGNLPDACTKIDQAQVDRKGDSFVVTLTTVRRPEGPCSPQASPYERLIRLDTASLPPARYSVLVNGKAASFSLPQAVAQVQASSGPVEPAANVSTRDSAAVAADVTSPAQAASPTSTPTAEASSPTATPTTTQPASEAPDCVEKAAFYGSESVPDGTFFDQGERFVKTWRVRNEGTCRWDESYRLVFAGGDPLSAPLSNSMPPTAPGEIAELSVQMAAPPGGGSHESNWMFEDGRGQRFGVGATGKGPIWARIQVKWIGAAGGTDQVVSGRNEAASPGNAPAQARSCPTQEDAGIESAVLALINEARQGQGLPPFTRSTALDQLARSHSADMACKGFTGHTGSDGLRPKGRLAAANIAFSRASEAIYFSGDAATAVNWWLQDPEHRDLVLSSIYTMIGIGFVHAPGTPLEDYYTAEFIRP